MERATNSGGPYTLVASPLGTSYADQGLANGTTYYYVISAIDFYGESLDSTEVSATTIPAGGTVYQNTILTDGPIGYWPLDLSVDTNTDSSGNLLATDLSGHGNTGVYRYLTVTNKMAGPSIFMSNSVNFDGVSSYVDLSLGSNPALLNINGKITMEAWVQPSSSTTYGDIMGKGYDSSLNSDELEMRANNGNYHGGTYNGTVDDRGANGGTESTNWTYVVCTYDGASWNLYVNAARPATGADTVGAYVFNDPWAIGSGTADGLSRCFQGNICQVALYTNALTSTQIANHYSRGRNGQTPAVPINLTATPHDGRISLSWNPSVGATSYSIKRAAVSGGSYTTIATAPGSGYVDASLVNGMTYYYVISASNLAGTSSNSAEVNATPLTRVLVTLNAQPQMGGTFDFSFTGQSNVACVIETSTNLIDWVAVLTNTSADGQFVFTGSNAMTDSARYYRVRQ